MVVHFEQAVYGSFAFRDQGYAFLAQSPGCRPEWLTDFRAACQNLGERPAGVPEAAGLFALRLPSGPWVVVGVSPQGTDDRGRPGALAFHGLFLAPREYRRAGSDPFALAGALKAHWSEQTRSLPSGSWMIEPTAGHDNDAVAGPLGHRFRIRRLGSESRVAGVGTPPPERGSEADARGFRGRSTDPGHPEDVGESPESKATPDPLAPRVAAALAKGRRVAIEAEGPIDGLARQVWQMLPERARARASVATWAFGNGNRFDLLAVPRLVGVALDASYLDPGSETGETAPTVGRRLTRPLVAIGIVAVVTGAGIGLALRGGGETEIAAPASVPIDSPLPASASPPPPRDGSDEDVRPDERPRAVEALTALADRFGVPAGGDPAPEPSSALMERIARDLRYRGPFLSDADREQLGREPGRDAALALQWDAQVRRFADDRPLPEGFRRGPLRWQLDVLAWSFHGEAESDAPGRSAEETVQALAESLAVAVALRPTALSARYPELSSYLAFLGRLPRR